jgi:hypothetical protein
MNNLKDTDLRPGNVIWMTYIYNNQEISAWSYTIRRGKDPNEYHTYQLFSTAVAAKQAMRELCARSRGSLI